MLYGSHISAFQLLQVEPISYEYEIIGILSSSNQFKVNLIQKKYKSLSGRFYCSFNTQFYVLK